MRVFYKSVFVPLAIAACLVSGCQVASVSEIGPQSHFNYPNSNVKALGPVKVSMDGPGNLFMLPPIRTGEIDENLYNTALTQVEGANLLIDYVRTTKIYMAPLIPIYWSTVELEGTAAKMELGQQVLR